MLKAYHPFWRARAAAGIVPALIVTLAGPVAAQDEGALRSFFEGKRVTLRIDMPGTSDGVDVQADSRSPLDFPHYRNDLKKYGTAIAVGETTTVTLVKIKKDHIEFQLGGGGFGTFWDDTSTSVYIPLVEKSDREKYLEHGIGEEDDRHKRRELERELDDLRQRREAENRRILAERARAEERKQERVARERLAGGSRFHIRYENIVPAGIRPEEVAAALAEYVDFGSLNAHLDVHRDGPLVDVLPFKGMPRAEAEKAYGRPLETTSRLNGDLLVTTLVFAARGQQIAAEFVDDVMVRYTITSK
jgi:hypothetical protein